MKYIFDLHWFNTGGGARNGITANDYQTTPPGGWNRWTAAHNVAYMTDMIAQEQNFTLMGDLRTLYGQATNAGRQQTRCMVGAEVLLLRSAGYTCSVRGGGEGVEVVCHFTHPGGPRIADATLVVNAISYLNDKGTSYLFWTDARKSAYQAVLDFVASAMP